MNYLKPFGTFILKIDDLELRLREPDFHRALTEVAMKSQKRTVEADSSIAYPIVLRSLVSMKEIPGDKSWTNLLSYYTNETVRIMAVGDWVAGKPKSDWMLLKVDQLKSVN